jgi:hypothetical protein
MKRAQGKHITMDPERREFLSLTATPARLTTQETAWLLGFAPHDIPILVRAGLLKPLGHPPRHGAKYFASSSLQPLRTDPKWLARASDAIVEHWRQKNVDSQSGPLVMDPAREFAGRRPGSDGIESSGLS